MSNAQRRGTEVVVAGLLDWLKARAPDRPGHPTVVSVKRPESGLSNETLVLTTRWEGAEETMVVRLAPLHPSFPHVDFAAQAAVHAALAAEGVPAPVPALHESEPGWVGGPFLAMPFVAGRIPGQVPVFDEWITDASLAEQRRLGEGLVDVLVGVHTVDWQGAGLGAHLRGAGGALRDEVAWWQGYIDWARGDGPGNRPLEEGLEWCRSTCPEDEPERVLTWGDARLGNLVVDEAFEVVGALDWETAALGPPETDLAWYLALDELQSSLLGAVAGLPGRTAVIDRWADGVGRDPIDLGWHEVFALVRAFAISDRQARVGAALEGASAPVAELEAHPLVGAIHRAIQQS